MYFKKIFLNAFFSANSLRSAAGVRACRSLRPTSIHILRAATFGDLMSSVASKSAEYARGLGNPDLCSR